MTSPDAGAGRGAGDRSDVGPEPVEHGLAGVTGAARAPAAPGATEPAARGETEPAAPGETEPAARGETEPAAPARGARGAGPLLPEQSPEDTDAAWGEYPQSARDRLYQDRPPHWDDF